MKLRTFYHLSKWALVLDCVFVLTVVSALCTWLYFNTIWGAVLLLPGLISLFKGVEIHSTLPKRYKAWRDLVNENMHAISHESFRPYITAPCGRALAIDVLSEINQPDTYKDLKDRYYNGFWGKDTESHITIIEYSKEDNVHECNQ